MLALSIGILVLLSLAAADSGGRAVLDKHGKRIFWGVVLLISAMGIYATWTQYAAWKAGEFTKLLLPEYQDNYFYLYVLTRIVAPYLLSFIFALVVLVVLPWINKINDGRFFEVGEPYVAATTIFIVGYPGWLFYSLLLIGVYTIWQSINNLRGRINIRLPLYGLWAPVGLAIFLMAQYWLAGTDIWLLLKI